MTVHIGDQRIVRYGDGEAWRDERIRAHARADWYALSNDEAAFEDRKQQYVERLIEAATIVVPKLKPHLKLVMPGTPLTFERFTERVNGMVGGFPQPSLFTAWSPQIERGVWLVGDSIFPGQSTAAVSLGALRVAGEVERGYTSVRHRISETGHWGSDDRTLASLTPTGVCPARRFCRDRSRLPGPHRGWY